MRSFMMMLGLMVSACTFNENVEHNSAPKGPSMNYGSEIFNGSPNGEETTAFTGKSVTGTMVCGGPNTLSMQAKFDAAGPHTIQFDLTPPVDRDILIGGVFSCEAIIAWSIAGNTVYRKVTVMDGMCITGNAEAVNIRIIDATTDIVFTGSTPPATYQVGATVTKGARATSSMPPVYIPNPAVTLVAGSSDVAVPDDIGANSVMVISSAPPAPDVNAAIAQQRCSNVNPGGLLGQWDPYAPRFVPLDSNALVIRLTAGASYMKVIFGIDG